VAPTPRGNPLPGARQAVAQDRGRTATVDVWDGSFPRHRHFSLNPSGKSLVSLILGKESEIIGKGLAPLWKAFRTHWKRWEEVCKRRDSAAVASTPSAISLDRAAPRAAAADRRLG